MAERGVLCSVRCTPLIFSYHVRQDEETLESPPPQSQPLVFPYEATYDSL